MDEEYTVGVPFSRSQCASSIICLTNEYVKNIEIARQLTDFLLGNGERPKELEDDSTLQNEINIRTLIIEDIEAVIEELKEALIELEERANNPIITPPWMERS